MRTRRCLDARTPETGTNHLGGSFDSFDAKAVTDANQAGRGESETHFCGEGVPTCTQHSNQPLAQCKGRSDSFTEISSDAPTTRRFGTPTPEEKARRLRRTEGRARRFPPRFPGRRWTPGNGGGGQ